MTRMTVAINACLLLACLAPQVARAEPPDGWTAEAMLRVKQVTGVQVSSDGKRVAYVVKQAVTEGSRSEYTAQIFVASADGSGTFALTQPEPGADGPQWSPDGETIGFLAKRSGKSQVWVIRANGGEASRLTDAKGDVVSFRWSPDGKRVAFAALDPTPADREKKVQEKDDARVVDAHVARNRLYVIDVEGRDVKRLSRRHTEGDLSVNGETWPGYDWSPDGKTIVFAHIPTPGGDDWTRSDISVVDVSTATVTPMAHTGRAESAPFYAPDGRTIAFVASDDPPRWAYDLAVYVMPAGGGKPKKLADSFDHRPELVGWAPDGKRVFFRENRGTTTRLYTLPLEGEPEAFGPDQGVIIEPALNASRTTIGFSFQRVHQPTEAYRIGPGSGEPVQLSRMNADMPGYPLGRTEAIRWKSTDAREIEGLLTYPVDYKEGQSYPLLLIIHGGPAAAFARTFIASAAVPTSTGRQSFSAYPVAAFAARGFAVLRWKVRGSSGYGTPFRHANHRDWGGGDFQDLMAGVDHVIKKGIADPDRLGVMGWSYGGFMTSWVIGHTKRFKAASVGAGVTDLVSFGGTSDIPSFLPSFFGAEPWEDAAIYRAHSPISHVKGINLPTLIQHGEDDERVPIGQGYELFSALKRQGCPVTMVVYPRAHHAIQEPKLQLDAMHRNLDWFDRHLLGKGSESAAARVGPLQGSPGTAQRDAALTLVGFEQPAPAAKKPRARDLGVPFEGAPGPFDAITDVAGIEVGHTTLISGEGKLEVGKGPVRTGVTAILPRGKRSTDPVFAGWFSLNGNGEMTGTTWIEESGYLEGPIMITNTHSVGLVRDAVIAYQIKRGQKDPHELWWSLPVVAETWDGFLNDINGFHVKQAHVFDALDGAQSGWVPEGNVGGGTGMICYGFKGGIGTASRRLGEAQGGYTVGVLVQANHGGRRQLRIGGAPVGQELADQAAKRAEAGSIIIVVATDAPLLPHQLKRIARRAALGLGRTGATSGNGSGDIFIAFSTARIEGAKPRENPKVEMLPQHRIDPLFEATVQATEEAIVNALVAAETMTGSDGHRAVALSHDQLKQILKKYNRLAEPAPEPGKP